MAASWIRAGVASNSSTGLISAPQGRSGLARAVRPGIEREDFQAPQGRQEASCRPCGAKFQTLSNLEPQSGVVSCLEEVMDHSPGQLRRCLFLSRGLVEQPERSQGLFVNSLTV